MRYLAEVVDRGWLRANGGVARPAGAGWKGFEGEGTQDERDGGCNTDCWRGRAVASTNGSAVHLRPPRPGTPAPEPFCSSFSSRASLSPPCTLFATPSAAWQVRRASPSHPSWPGPRATTESTTPSSRGDAAL